MESPSQLCPLAEKAAPHNWISTWAWCVQGRQGGPHWPDPSSIQHLPHDPGARPHREIPIHLLPGGCCPWPGYHGLSPSLQSFITFTQLFPKFVLTNFSWLVVSKLPHSHPRAHCSQRRLSYFTPGEDLPPKCWHPWFAAMFFSFSPFEKENSKKRVTCRIIHAKLLQSS